jgi:DNA-binding CsgD family transcriptional regulator
VKGLSNNRITCILQDREGFYWIGTEDYHLSDREKEILNMMTEGHNFRTIASKAFISYETVRTHVKKIYKKLHVASRNEAILKASQQRLV